MKDLIIKNTGNSRWMKSSIPRNITHQELVDLLNEGVFPFDLNGLNPEGIEQMGTAISKATLLKDETAEKLGLEAGATVDEALLVVGLGATEKVGDIKVSIRTDLGDKYLLANGAVLRHRGDYPKLGELFPAANNLADATGSEYMDAASPIDLAANASYSNGLFLTANFDSAIGGYVVYTSESLTGEWTARSVISTTRVVTPQKIKWSNGKWFATMDSNTIGFFVTDDLDREWEYCEPNGSHKIWDVCYYDGLYVAVGTAYISSTARVAVFSATNLSTWTRRYGSASVTGMALSVECVEGQYLCAVYVSSLSSSYAGSLVKGLAVLASNDGLTWVEYQASVWANKSCNRAGINYYGGRWLASFTGSSVSGVWYSGRTVGNSWGGLYTTSLNSVTIKMYEISSILYFLQSSASGGAVAETTSPTTGITMKSTSNRIPFLIEKEEEGVWSVIYGNTATGDASGLEYIGSVLPVVTIDNAYAYIRAKE